METKKRKTTSKREQAIARFKPQVDFWKENFPIDKSDLPSPRIFGENVRKHRETIKMTQGEVGKQLNLSAESISRIEQGDRKKVDIDLVYQLAAILSCSPDCLLRSTDKSDGILDQDKNKYKQPVLPASPLRGDFLKSCDLMLTRCPRLAEAVAKLLKTNNVAIYDMVATQIEAAIDYAGLSK